jgi:hypothetical protein
MKQVILVSVTALVFLAIGIIAGKNTFSKKCTKKHETSIKDDRVVIIPVGNVDGRIKYNVLFNDGDSMKDMYAEEIANGLITEEWDYNEHLELTVTGKERAY